MSSAFFMVQEGEEEEEVDEVSAYHMHTMSWSAMLVLPDSSCPP